MVSDKLVAFIKEARSRGYDDYQIKKPLLDRGWKLEDVEDAFASLKPKVRFKNKISIFLDSDVLKALDRRAKRNLFTISEQIEDILRRSVITGMHTAAHAEKLDDMLVSLFSRKRRK